MKTKRLFSLTMVALTITASAQHMNGHDNFNVSDKVSAEKVSNLMNAGRTVKQSFTKSSNNIETRAGEVSYARPQGTFWSGINKDFTKYNVSFLYVPGWTSLKFVNKSMTPANTKWYFEEAEVPAELVDQSYNLDYAFSVDHTEDMMAHVPTLKEGSNVYKLGSYNSAGSYALSTGDDKTVMSTYDVAGEIEAYTGFDTGTYIFGSDVAHNENENEIMSSALIMYEKPAAPLYVSSIYFPIASESGSFLPEGTKMTLKIRKMAPREEDGLMSPTDEVLFEMEATSKDIIDSDGNLKLLNFSNKEFDPVAGTEVDAPFTLNEAFALELVGFNQPGVDMGLLSMATRDEPVNSYLCFESEPGAYYSYNGLTCFASIMGYFNVINIEGDTRLKAPEEGGYAVDEATETYNALGVFTTLKWSDENFWFEGTPDWLDITVSEENIEEGYYLLSFTAEPGTNRSCYLTLKSFGVEANRKIIIAQGTTGISVTEANEVNAVRNGNNFELTYGNDVTSVEVMNAAGQLVANYNLNGTSFVMPAANLANGLYILKFNGEKATTVKIVK